MHGGKASRVSGVEKLQEIEGLASTDLTDIRTGHACGWCEIKDGVLTLIPHPDSGEETRTFRYPSEVSVVGRVTGIARSIGEEDQALLEEAIRCRTPPKK